MIGLKATFNFDLLLQQGQDDLFNVALSNLDKRREFLQALAVDLKEHKLIAVVIIEIVRVYPSSTDNLLQSDDIISFDLPHQYLLEDIKVTRDNSIEPLKYRGNVLPGMEDC
jgi:hypothetical protein